MLGKAVKISLNQGTKKKKQRHKTMFQKRIGWMDLAELVFYCGFDLIEIPPIFLSLKNSCRLGSIGPLTCETGFDVVGHSRSL